MNYEVIIGIEIHLELKTETKMFSGAPAAGNYPPNRAVSAIDLAIPGTLPVLNRQAVIFGLMTCEALHCRITDLLRFDRKNYFYSDLTKGYQITQQFHPLGQDGYLDIEVGQQTKRIRINRVHLEEDTAKQFHQEDGLYLDFNRCGIPLLEIVTEADLRSGEEAMTFIDKLRLILYYLGVSDCRMEEGSLRCDINISLRPFGYEGFGQRVEVKNLNSVANVGKAIEAEINRQTLALNQGEVIDQATYRYADDRRETVLMRRKEGAVDYKYFPEPNIPPIRLSLEFIKEALANWPELPEERRQRYRSLGLSEYDSQQLVNTKELGDYFDQVCRHSRHYKLACNWILGDFSAYLIRKRLSAAECEITAENLAELLELIDAEKISSKQAKEVFKEMENGKTAKEVVNEQGIEQLSDDGSIQEFVSQVIADNPQAVVDYHQGKDRAQGYLVGQIMKLSQGRANPAKVSEMLTAALAQKKKEN